MSRMLGACFILSEAATTIATFFHSSSIFLVAIISVLTSLVFAAAWSFTRSIFWPTYFWNPSEPVQVVALNRSLQKPDRAVATTDRPPSSW